MASPEHGTRHALVRLRPDAAWRAVDPAFRPQLARWFAADRPAVLARLQGDEPAGHWRLGVPLPPAEGKRRLALTVAPAEVRSCRPPLQLREALAAAPADWRAPIGRLLERADALALEPRVYGSFAWQALTGLAYVTPASDLDLAWRPRDMDQLHALFAAIQDWEAATGRRADGEILLPGGDAVCWRELAGTAARVLVKRADGVLLQARGEVLETLDVGRERDARLSVAG